MNHYVNPNGFILRTPINCPTVMGYGYPQQGTHRNAPVILGQHQFMSGPSNPYPSRVNYYQQQGTPVIRHQPWSNPTQRFDASGRIMHNLQGKRVFQDNDVQVNNSNKRKRHADSPSTSESSSKKLRPVHTVVTPNSSSGTSSTSQRKTSGTLHNTPTGLPSRTTNPVVDSLDKFSSDIWTYYLKKRQTKADLSKKVALRNELFAVIRKMYPYGGLFLVGSSMNGFGSTNSDVDLCLMISMESISQKSQATRILHRVLSQLRQHCFNFLRRAQVIPAKVPILKFWDQIREVECDLNINNSTGVRNTYLLQIYSKLDWRVAPLMLTIKQWASEAGINDASKGTLSSYSIVLMVLHYLQAGVVPPVLPSLQGKYPKMFESNCSVWKLKSLAPEDKLPVQIVFESMNKLSLGDLLLKFFKYYANDFNFATNVMSVRLGRTLPLSCIDKLGDWKNKFIHIEEPFDRTNTARAVYNSTNFKLIQVAFNQTNYKLARSKTLRLSTLFETR